eukprot:CAMPEP_0204584124 /NCGR_PEP_ID=MMETSP0661-20131031/46169_1 /ASSEMBLY_ACC=CAM_ASM_000606 /TAXON_ID=109239 /ORGANISM="Alexandrium margalefi, Strain AMGDE01CS-322" /LENGTH=30 /DNA_ID= /DNA_START= /DNA_END= /DNA_ORIENTATION=
MSMFLLWQQVMSSVSHALAGTRMVAAKHVF